MLNNHAAYELLITLFSSYVENFGNQFTIIILDPIFNEIIVDLEKKLEKLHAVNVDSFVVVGIYLVTILVSIKNVTQCGEFLQK